MLVFAKVWMCSEGISGDFARVGNNGPLDAFDGGGVKLVESHDNVRRFFLGRWGCGHGISLWQERRRTFGVTDQIEHRARAQGYCPGAHQKCWPVREGSSNSRSRVR
jgi:hypothetical protein